MIYGPHGMPGTAWGQAPAASSGTKHGSMPGAFTQAIAGAFGTDSLDALGEAARSAASSAVSGTAGMDTVSAWGHTDEIQGATLEEMLVSVHPQLSYHVMDCSSKNWIRNDFPHYKLFQKNVNKYEIENWRPSGDEPTQANSPASHKLGQVAPGSVAVVIHPAVQQKMEENPEYAREIFERIEAWFAFDDARNAAIRAAHGETGSGIEKRAVAIGEDGNITNALAAGGSRLTVSSSGSRNGRKELSSYEKRLLRHDQYMEELVERQIDRKIMMSQQLNAMSLAASAKQNVLSMMADPKLRAALGDKIGGTPIDTVFDISMQHINAAAAGGIF